MNPEQLKNVHSILLEIALEVKRICDLHNIQYFLVGGSLLGSIRHAGFIPWDDDFDIGMLRSEYERFIHFATLELDGSYFLQHYYTDTGMNLSYLKVRKNGTRFVEKVSMDVKWHQGIFVDIFPFDNAPDNYFAKALQHRSTYILQWLLLIKAGFNLSLYENNIYKSLIYKMILNPLSSFFPRNALISSLEYFSQRHNMSYTETIVAIGGSYGYEKERFPREWISDLVLMPFDNHSFLCPSRYHSYLSNLYGNFMIPPPVDQRGDRHMIVDFYADEIQDAMNGRE